jgi:hypothetical protein
MTSLIDIQSELESNIKFQATPIPMSPSDYLSFTIKGVKRLYTDEGIEDNFLVDFDKVNNTLTRDLTLTELEYSCISAEIAFRNQIKDDLSSIVSYSTNALSVSNGDKPYKNLKEIVDELESRLAKLAFKFTHKQVQS